MSKFATIEISKEYLKFSSAHFTIFSKTERERLHGHNFSVSAKFEAEINTFGLCFDYGVIKNKLRKHCAALDEYMLLPGKSPFLEISQDDVFHLVRFNQEEMQFLVADTLILPLLNISVEELSGYILDQLLADPDIYQSAIRRIEVSVASGPGQMGTQVWTAADHD